MSREKTKGAAILIFLTVLVLALATVLVGQISINEFRTSIVIDNAKLLKLASRSLLGYALDQPVPGTLPCPDTTGDGLENASGGNCSSQLGLLPTRTLGLDQVTDNTGAALWYAVELSYVANDLGLRNSSRVSTLAIDGQLMAAIVIAPGKALLGQGRVPFQTSDFLEGINADGSTNLYSQVLDDTQNDQLLGIGVGPFWSLIEQKVLSDTEVLLNAYKAACLEFPWAASFGGTYDSVANLQSGALPLNSALPSDWGTVCAAGTAPTPAVWLTTHWADHNLYRMCTLVQGTCVTITGTNDSPATGVVLLPGLPLAGQTRASISINDYFEGDNDDLPDNLYNLLSPVNHTETYNDVSNPL